MTDVLTRTTADLILGVTWVIACQQILYADELPGDGFTAGVFVLVAVMLQHVVLGRDEATEKLPARAFFAAALVGIAVLVLLFVVPMTWGGQPLQHFHVPLGSVALSSTTLFDLGIFLAIAGALVAGVTSVQESPE